MIRHLRLDTHLLPTTGGTEIQVPQADGSCVTAALGDLRALQIWSFFLPHSARAGFANLLAVTPCTSSPGTFRKKDVGGICVYY